tara:strand:+ start:1308 stop:1439 length:132 start_codon:yes stop_codon:yes gene_type:complete
MEEKNSWLILKEVIKESAIEIANGFYDISKMIFDKGTKESKHK